MTIREALNSAINHSLNILREAINGLQQLKYSGMAAWLHAKDWKMMLSGREGEDNYNAITWDSADKLENPEELPGAAVYGASWHPGGHSVALSLGLPPYIAIYGYEDGQFIKKPNPAILPDGLAADIKHSPNGQYLAVAHQGGDYLTIYKYTDSIYVKIIDVNITLPVDGLSLSWSEDSNYLAVGHYDHPYVTIFSRAGDVFTKMTDPPDLPTLTNGSGPGVVWSPDGNYLAVVFGYSTPLGDNPNFIIYKFEGGTFTKLGNVPSLPGWARDIDWSGNNYLAVSVQGFPYVVIYRFESEELTQIDFPNVSHLDYDPTVTNIRRVEWSPNGRYLCLVHFNHPYKMLFEQMNGTFVKLDDHADLPTGVGRGIGWSPNNKILIIGHDSSPFMTIYEAIDPYRYVFNNAISIHLMRGAKSGIRNDIRRLCNMGVLTSEYHNQSECGWISGVTSPGFYGDDWNIDKSITTNDLDNMLFIYYENNSIRTRREVRGIIRREFVPIMINTRFFDVE